MIHPGWVLDMDARTARLSLLCHYEAHMAAFTSSDRGERDSYVAKWRKILANDEITKKVILVNDEIAGSIGSYVIEGEAAVTYWIWRDLWGRGIASAALAELLREVAVRPLYARAAADNAGSEGATTQRVHASSRGDLLR
jgi:RimJ/RimL family protein N-acetyltransferase